MWKFTLTDTNDLYWQIFTAKSDIWIVGVFIMKNHPQIIANVNISHTTAAYIEYEN